MGNDAQRYGHVLIDVHLVAGLKFSKFGPRRNIIISKNNVLLRLLSIRYTLRVCVDHGK
jgi:ABC-type iron transport system FetAB permease component